MNELLASYIPKKLFIETACCIHCYIYDIMAVASESLCKWGDASYYVPYSCIVDNYSEIFSLLIWQFR